MTRVSPARPDVPNGKPLGRHVDPKRHREGVLVPSAPRPPAPQVSAPHLSDARVAAPRAKRHKKVASNAVTVMSVSAGIVATVALPSHAIPPDQLHAGGLRAGTVHAVEVQSFAVPAAARPADAARDLFSATTMEELEAQRAKKLAEERAFAEAKQHAIEAATAGWPIAPIATTSVPLAAPAQVPYGAPPARDGSVVAVARQYLGVPYIFGGASPSGFDCSGLTMYVYAQFGISLPHSSLRQAADGSPVTDPVPGDLVVIDGGSHIGIYSGGGYMIDAPMPGRVVNERPIYTSNHSFVRY
ncbi:C40 family peptidase [Lysobacter korlensis]|uniref:C40 family peptidase n=1 Tax=Lysobacter korlensis TaxID=553636 RepID=A0ABV6RVC4_9GAMM